MNQRILMDKLNAKTYVKILYILKTSRAVLARNKYWKLNESTVA